MWFNTQNKYKEFLFEAPEQGGFQKNLPLDTHTQPLAPSIFLLGLHSSFLINNI